MRLVFLRSVEFVGGERDAIDTGVTFRRVLVPREGNSSKAGAILSFQKKKRTYCSRIYLIQELRAANLIVFRRNVPRGGKLLFSTYLLLLVKIAFFDMHSYFLLMYRATNIPLIRTVL